MARMGSHLVTADELLQMPREVRCELVRGEVRAVSPAGFRHGRVAQRLAQVAGSFVEQHRLGVWVGPDTGFWIERAPDTVRSADGAFLRAARVRAIPRDCGYVEGAPDLAIEILSPTDRRKDAIAKCRTWVAAGALVAVLIDPDRQTATVFAGSGTVELAADASLTFGEVIPGLAIPLRDLFADD